MYHPATSCHVMHGAGGISVWSYVTKRGDVCCILQASAWCLTKTENIFVKHIRVTHIRVKHKKSHPGLPLVRLTLKIRSPATAAASRQFLHASTA